MVTVANASSANVTIAKSATPNGSVAIVDTITYSLLVTNTGPASGTDVIVTDSVSPLLT